MVLGRGKAATHLNSWSRCLDREDGIRSPASLSSLTAVACTKSWSQMAARWKSIRRRTGETTVRIFIATRPVNRNWVRNPISASLPSDVTCALHSYSTDFDVWDIMCSDAKQLISMERKGREMAPCSSPKANSGSWGWWNIQIRRKGLCGQKNWKRKCIPCLSFPSTHYLGFTRCFPCQQYSALEALECQLPFKCCSLKYEQDLAS